MREAQYDDSSSCGTVVNSVGWLALRDGNYWFRRFESVQIGCGWVDFENEIARVTISIERSMYDDHGRRVFVDDDVKWNELCYRNRLFSDGRNPRHARSNRSHEWQVADAGV